jgi:hypothetical protein
MSTNLIDKEQIEKNREYILALFGQTSRPGIDDLREWLKGSDFFTAPSSTGFHLSCRGGLAQHSLNVFNVLEAKAASYYGPVLSGIDPDSIVICGLCHDLCKVNTFVENGGECSDDQFRYFGSLLFKHGGQRREDFRIFYDEEGHIKRQIPPKHASILIEWLKAGAREQIPELPVTYAVKDDFPFGHGEKSVSILQDFIKLKNEEKLAIRWHMGMSEAGTHFFYPTGIAFQNAQKLSPLVSMLQVADYEAAQILERE